MSDTRILRQEYALKLFLNTPHPGDQPEGHSRKRRRLRAGEQDILLGAAGTGKCDNRVAHRGDPTSSFGFGTQ